MAPDQRPPDDEESLRREQWGLEELSKIKFWSRILSHTVKELFRSILYKKSRKPLKTKAFGVVHWRP